MSQGVEDALLTDLCSICHINPPKYQCPRCEIRTCSLPCVKRHKLLSECSGKRDPAAYRKRKDLATPKTFDQDFNFITGLERSLERADRDAQDRGVALIADDFYGRRPMRGEQRLRHEIERSGVEVRKAPTGMTRNRQNRTHWQQRSKHISWTVEWFLDGNQKILSNSAESTPIIKAFANAVPKKLQQSRKRKHEDLGQTVPADSQSPILGSETKPSPDPNPTAMRDSDSESHYHFYLHRPELGGHQCYVTHLTASTTLGDALRGHLVLEFPTIYALQEAPEKLPENFSLTTDQTLSAGQPSIDLPPTGAAAASSSPSSSIHLLSNEVHDLDTRE